MTCLDIEDAAVVRRCCKLLRRAYFANPIFHHEAMSKYLRNDNNAKAPKVPKYKYELNIHNE